MVDGNKIDHIMILNYTVRIEEGDCSREATHRRAFSVLNEFI